MSAGAVPPLPVPAGHSTKPTPGRRWIGYARSRGLWLGVALLVAQALVAGGAALDWRLDLLSHFQVQYLLLALLSFAVAAGTLAFARPWTRRDGLLFALLALAAGWAAARALAPSPGPAEAPAAGPPLRLKILLANVFRDNREPERLLALIRERQPDLILLQEVTSVWREALGAVAGSHPHRFVNVDDEGCFGTGLWSRWPLVEPQWTQLDSHVWHLRTTVATPAGLLLLLGVHPLPPMSEAAAAQRSRVFAAIAGQVKATPGPALVLGDLNCTRFSPHFADLCESAGLRDLAAELKLQRTWPAGLANFWLGIRIDHVLGDPGWRTWQVDVGPNVGSDHYPVWIELERGAE